MNAIFLRAESEVSTAFKKLTPKTGWLFTSPTQTNIQSMRLKYAKLSVTGPVRSINEDYITFWEPEDPLERRQIGSIAILADGVGGQGDGDVASRLAVETALGIFQKQSTELPPEKLMPRIFEEANSKVYDAARKNLEKGHMATTLVVAIFRDDKVTLGHVGDSRSYLLRHGVIRRLTMDHSYTAMQVRMGLLLERDAMASKHRSTLTRCIGHEPFCHFDLNVETLQSGDIIVQCTDGLYGYVIDDEINSIVSNEHPYDACKKLLALAERRQSDDNLSLQILHIREVESTAVPNPARTDTRVRNSSLRKTSMSGDVEVGTLLDGRFEITDLISRSGMAEIFKANDTRDKHVVALKVPLMKFESDMAGFSRFEREEQIGTTLDHPYILKMYPITETKSRPYIVMEYLEGETLDQVLHHVRPMPEADAVKIASRICGALAYMHNKGVVHRDLKPQNIMVCNDGSLRIMDFGIAKSGQSRRLTFVGFTPSMGTPDYMAPEQVKGKRGDERTDIYSLGAILYEMTTGSTPFEGESPYVIMNARVTGDPVAPRRINPRLTEVIEEIILHSLERTPNARFESAEAMKTELDDYEKTVLTHRYMRLRSPQPWKNKFTMLPMLMAFVIAQIVIFAALYVYFFEAKPQKHRNRVSTQQVQEEDSAPTASSNDKTTPPPQKK